MSHLFNSIVTTAVCVRMLSPLAVQAADVPSTPWGDQGDGTFANPVLPADFSDIDAIRVGDDYYAISSTFQYQPGMVILASKDLVNWRIAGHAVDDIRRIGPELNWDRMNRYGRGVWAGAIRFHDGKFWVYFGTPDEGFFVTSAKDPAGPWEPVQPFWKTSGCDDGAPFWDDDGQGYFVCTNFKDKYKIHLFKMTPDNLVVVPESDRVLYQGPGSEANKLYKIGGVYYHLFSEVHGSRRSIWMRRSKSLDGPWETRQINQVAGAADKEPNQGGLIELPSGAWWFVTHQGKGDWEGRAMCLLPVTWIEGWPIIGKPDENNIGTMVWAAKKPIDGQSISMPQTSDEFDATKLAAQWEWNYYPRDEKWSLTERPGFLRLHAFKPLKAGDFFKAGNTLTQRGWRADQCDATTQIDIAGMADGQTAGLVHYAKTYCCLGVRQTNGTRVITLIENGKAIDGPALKTTTVWLKSKWGQDGLCQFSFSVDSQSFTEIGTPYRLTWGNYRGNRIGIFSYNDAADRGHIDVDWFHLTCAMPNSH